MKYVVISKLAPGTDNAKKAFAVFGKVGTGEASSVMAATDAKTFINIVESDSPDMTVSVTYAPFFESTTVIPVVDIDADWIKAVQTAMGNWS
jgi:hypothetical protein